MAPPPALRTLVERFGGKWPTTDDVAELARRLYDFSQVWDRRSGQHVSTYSN